jgi:hypothetical protein
MIQAPEILIRSIEKLYMDVTEPLDPYIALALTNLTTKLAETVYVMGYQDGKSFSSPAACGSCQQGKCVSGVFQGAGI